MQKPGSQHAFDPRRRMQGEMLRSRDSSIAAADQRNSLTSQAGQAQVVCRLSDIEFDFAKNCLTPAQLCQTPHGSSWVL